MKHSHNFIDRAGQRYGKLTVLYYDESSSGGDAKWICECDCGNKLSVFADSLNSGHTRSCGCMRHVSRKAKDMTGQRFGFLTVTSRSGTENGKATWNCRCDCGKEIVRTGDLLRRGQATNCGCQTSRIKSEKLRTHGLRDSRIYYIWTSMKERVLNQNSKSYKHYGGRGISICDEWESDFMAFYNWAMENGYSDELSIDRINVNGNYEPNNCRWVDSFVQMNNMTTNHYITINKETHTLAEWCRIKKISQSTVFKRMKRGLPEEMWFEKNIRLTKKGVELWQEQLGAHC